jgi:cytochrome c biogenesis protein CcmG/thiol:disulfide interchange protein DsbE
MADKLEAELCGCSESRASLRGRLIGGLMCVALAAGLLGAWGSPAMAEGVGPLNLNAYKGKVVYLDFWASWCGPCKQSFPYMMSLERKYGSDGFVVIAVNVDKDRSKAEAFLRKTGHAFPIIFDPKGMLPSKYKIKDMPTSILIGRHGQIRFVHKGFYAQRESAYEEQIRELINES